MFLNLEGGREAVAAGVDCEHVVCACQVRSKRFG